MYEIKTTDYVKARKILVDDKNWTMYPPGAGDELALNQGKRRAELLDKKIQNGTATDEDYDTYDRIENQMFSIFKRIFKDGTSDNAQVEAWLNGLPMVVIMAILEDIQNQAKVKADGENGTTTEAEVS